MCINKRPTNIHSFNLYIYIYITPGVVLDTLLCFHNYCTYYFQRHNDPDPPHVAKMSLFWGKCRTSHMVDLCACKVTISVNYQQFTPEELDKLIKHGNIVHHIKAQRDRGSTVVKVLCYKPEGRWFEQWSSGTPVLCIGCMVLKVK